MNMAEMAKEVAALLVDSMDDETMEIHLRCYIAEDFLNNPEHYTHEVAEVEELLAEEEKFPLDKEEIYED